MRHSSIAVIAVVSTVAFTQIAIAADMPVKAPRPVVAPVPIYTWTGCYFGGHAGGDWAKSHWTYSNVNPYDALGPSSPIVGTDNDFDKSSWIAGVQVGCNYQFAGNWVAGIEGSWSGTDLDKTVNNVVQVFSPDSVQTVTTQINSIATATARIGYSFAPPWLVYAKGGYAGGRIETSGRTAPGFPGFNLDWDTSRWHNGWTVSGGFEYRVWKNVTLGIEYDFIRLTADDHVGPVSGGAITAANQIVHSVDADIQSVRARVNFLFGPGY
jgi:outer membrane immunogenic protein